MPRAIEYTVTAEVRDSGTILEVHKNLTGDECSSAMCRLWAKYPDRNLVSVKWKVTKRA